MRTVSAEASVAFAALALAFAAAPSIALAVEVVDATGTRVKLVDHPMRIVTLAPSLGELVADVIGAAPQKAFEKTPEKAPQKAPERVTERIVGVSDYTDYPEGLKKIPSVGSYAKFSLEKVASLKPDLVLATLDGNARDQIDHLRELKLPVVVVATSGFDQIADSMRLVGRSVGDEARGKEIAEAFSKGLREARARAGRRSKKPSVFLQLNDDPVMTAGKGTFLSEALDAVGATNLYGDSKIAYPKPSLEDILKRNPDAIVVLAMTGDQEVFERMARKWEAFAGLRAVKAKRVRIIKADTVTRPTLRLLEGLKLLERAIYGD